MLSTFTIKRHFNALKVAMYVDCEKREAEITCTYQRRLRYVGKVQFALVGTPEDAERYLSRDSVSHPELGNMIEALEAQYRGNWGIAA